MNATATVLDSGRALHQDPVFRLAASTCASVENQTDAPLQIERLLKRAGLTMVQISADTRARFGESSPYFIPQTFLYKNRCGVTPHLCQIAALSEITGHRFAKWMQLCGFDLSMILSLQIRIPSERTKTISPRSALGFEPSALRAGWDATRYCYAKVGFRDAVLYPFILPGSIVRADRHYPKYLLTKQLAGNYVWLVEHPAGITCCRIKPVSNEEIVLLPSHPPLSSWPLRLSNQVRILGIVDQEMPAPEPDAFHPMHKASHPETLASWPCTKGGTTFSKLLRKSRLAIGLTFRESHKISLRIATAMGDRNYAISTGLLSDYEVLNRIPRHVQKVISLCVIYGIDPWELFASAGLQVKDSQKCPLVTANFQPLGHSDSARHVQ